MSKRSRKEARQLIQSIRREIDELADVHQTSWKKIDENIDRLGAAGGGAGLLSVLLAGAGPIGWTIAGVGAGVALYDRLVRKPRKAVEEERRQQRLDVLTYQIEQLERDLLGGDDS